MLLGYDNNVMLLRPARTGGGGGGGTLRYKHHKPGPHDGLVLNIQKLQLTFSFCKAIFISTVNVCDLLTFFLTNLYGCL